MSRSGIQDAPYTNHDLRLSKSTYYDNAIRTSQPWIQTLTNLNESRIGLGGESSLSSRLLLPRAFHSMQIQTCATPTKLHHNATLNIVPRIGSSYTRIMASASSAIYLYLLFAVKRLSRRIGTNRTSASTSALKKRVDPLQCHHPSWL
jgi:hypothetical protein